MYMNIEEPLPEYIELEYHDEIWQQPIDYEHIPFRCRRCHEYGNLFRKYPQNKEVEITRTQEEEQRRTEGLDTGDEGFKEIQKRKKPSKEGTKIQQKDKSVVAGNQNKFQVLQVEEEENEGERKE